MNSMYHQVDVIQVEMGDAWNRYVEKHKNATPYHLFQWMQIIASAYGHKIYPLAAIERYNDSKTNIVGILPLVHMKDFFGGNRLVSMPFFDHGGIIADSPDIEMELIKSAILLAQKLKARRIELRHLEKLTSVPGTDHEEDNLNDENGMIACKIGQKKINFNCSIKTNKVHMLLNLPSSSELLMKNFKSKLRSQIKRPMKVGLTSKIGGLELLDDFYQIFSFNMRDLGSPVHGKEIFSSILNYFNDSTKVFIIYNKVKPIAGSIVFGFKDLMANPWSSSLRNYSKDSPNMLLYWKMLAYGADHGYQSFDFGRSTPDQGTYRFKSQWGAQPKPMYWYTFWLDKVNTGKVVSNYQKVGKNRAFAESLWRRLPEPISRFLGPKIRKHIEL